MDENTFQEVTSQRTMSLPSSGTGMLQRFLSLFCKVFLNGNWSQSTKDAQHDADEGDPSNAVVEALNLAKGGEKEVEEAVHEREVWVKSIVARERSL